MLLLKRKEIPDAVPTPGYDGYFVDRSGRVFSEWTHGRPWKRGDGLVREIKAVKQSTGYWTVGLRVRRGEFKTFALSRLICLAFYGPPPPGGGRAGATASHLDGNKDNNNVVNLAWETMKINIGRRKEHGTLLEGPDNPQSILSKTQVEAIRVLLKKGDKTQTKIAAMYNISPNVVSRISRGLTYKNI